MFSVVSFNFSRVKNLYLFAIIRLYLLSLWGKGSIWSRDFDVICFGHDEGARGC